MDNMRTQHAQELQTTNTEHSTEMQTAKDRYAAALVDIGQRHEAKINGKNTRISELENQLRDAASIRTYLEGQLQNAASSKTNFEDQLRVAGSTIANLERQLRDAGSIEEGSKQQLDGATSIKPDSRETTAALRGIDYHETTPVPDRRGRDGTANKSHLLDPQEWTKVGFQEVNPTMRQTIETPQSKPLRRSAENRVGVPPQRSTTSGVMALALEPSPASRKRKHIEEPGIKAPIRRSTRGLREITKPVDADSLADLHAAWSVWLEDGELVTNKSVEQDAWEEITEAFQLQLRGFPDWDSAKVPFACAFTTTPRWTHKMSGQFACKTCYNARRFCVTYVEANKRFEVLRLPTAPGLTEDITIESFIRAKDTPHSSVASLWTY
ncbi:hypothetical protein KCU65_g9108, partial [Aureobasidium melanogenum]